MIYRVYIILAIILACSVSGFAQTIVKPLEKRIIIKTNILNLAALRPTLTAEKFFSKTFSTEVSFVQGRFNNILFTDHYEYNGFLLRAKKYFDKIDYGNVNPFAALYIGNLKRTIQTTGHTDNSGWLGYPSRDFSANSIRGGGSFGLSIITKKKIVVEGMGSLGYGRYIKYYKPDTNAKGYLDAQVWLSVGYAF